MGPQNPVFCIYLTANDVGRTFVATASDPYFSTLATTLANGNSDSVTCSATLIGSGWISSLTRTEANFFSPLPQGGNGIDFEGFQISSLILRVNRLTINSSPTLSSYSSDFSVFVVGVPEPESYFLLLGSLTLFGLFRCGKRPRSLNLH